MVKGATSRRSCVNRPEGKTSRRQKATADLHKKGSKVNRLCSGVRTLQFIDGSSMRQGQIDCFYHIENRAVLTKYSGEILQLHSKAQPARVLLPRISRTQSASLYERESFLNLIDAYIAFYKGEEETFFLTSSIIDRYLNKISVESVSKKEFNLIGLTAFFIASKMEDIAPPCLMQFQMDVGKNQYTAEEILDKEIEMLNAIDFDLDYVSVYDIILTYLCDFAAYTKERGMSSEVNEVFTAVFSSTVLFAKICEVDESSKAIPTPIKAICCIILAFDYETSKKALQVSTKGESFIRLWFDIMVKGSGVLRDELLFVYNSIRDTFNIVTGKYASCSGKAKRLSLGKSK